MPNNFEKIPPDIPIEPAHAAKPEDSEFNPLPVPGEATGSALTTPDTSKDEGSDSEIIKSIALAATKGVDIAYDSFLMAGREYGQRNQAYVHGIEIAGKQVERAGRLVVRGIGSLAAKGAGIVSKGFITTGGKVKRAPQASRHGIEIAGKQVERAGRLVVRGIGSLAAKGAKVSLPGREAAGELWARNRLKKLDELNMKSGVYSIAAKSSLIPGRLPEKTAHLESERKAADKEIIRKHYTAQAPVTAGERLQARRSNRRMSSNMRRAIVNRNYELTFRKGSLAFGGQAYNDALAAERHPWRVRGTIKGAAKKYARNQRVIDRRVGRVQASAEGIDIPGQYINYRQRRLQERAEKYRSRLGLTEEPPAETDEESYHQTPLADNLPQFKVDWPMVDHMPEELAILEAEERTAKLAAQQNLTWLKGIKKGEIDPAHPIHFSDDQLKPLDFLIRDAIAKEVRSRKGSRGLGLLPQAEWDQLKDEVRLRTIQEYLGEDAPLELVLALGGALYDYAKRHELIPKRK